MRPGQSSGDGAFDSLLGWRLPSLKQELGDQRNENEQRDDLVVRLLGQIAQERELYDHLSQIHGSVDSGIDPIDRESRYRHPWS